MRYLFGLMCVLALGVMGCSETAIGPCIGVDDRTACTVDGSCQIAYECSSAEDGALCLLTESPTAPAYGFCVDGSCEPPQ